MKIILTGANGNLGRHLQKLGSQHQWIAVDRQNWSELDRLFAQGCDMVLHAAADLLTPVSKNPAGVMDSNLNSTIKILNLMSKYSVKRLDFISSCAVYGMSQVTNEQQHCAPISINGITKLLNEKIIQEFCTVHGMEYRLFRIFNTFGGNDRFSILAQLKKSLDQKKPFNLFNEGLSQRDFIYVDDVANVILQLLEKPLPSPLLNIGSGRTTRIRDIVDKAWQQNPKLEIRKMDREEAEYSRADISLLNSLVGPYSFKKIEDYIETEWDINA